MGHLYYCKVCGTKMHMDTGGVHCLKCGHKEGYK